MVDAALDKLADRRTSNIIPFVVVPTLQPAFFTRALCQRIACAAAVRPIPANGPSSSWQNGQQPLEGIERKIPVLPRLNSRRFWGNMCRQRYTASDLNLYPVKPWHSFERHHLVRRSTKVCCHAVMSSAVFTPCPIKGEMPKRMHLPKKISSMKCADHPALNLIADAPETRKDGLFRSGQRGGIFKTLMDLLHTPGKDRQVSFA